jgi:hypothetical protein
MASLSHEVGDSADPLLTAKKGAVKTETAGSGGLYWTFHDPAFLKH